MLLEEVLTRRPEIIWIGGERSGTTKVEFMQFIHFEKGLYGSCVINYYIIDLFDCIFSIFVICSSISG